MRIYDLNGYQTFGFAMRTKIWVVVEFFFGNLQPGIFDFSLFGLTKVLGLTYMNLLSVKIDIGDFQLAYFT